MRCAPSALPSGELMMLQGDWTMVVPLHLPEPVWVYKVSIDLTCSLYRDSTNLVVVLLIDVPLAAV